MTTTWRSSALRLGSEHCAAALSFYEEGAPYDRERFAVGTAAHDCLEAIGKASATAGSYLPEQEAEEVAREVCELLISRGREFDGRPEPPLSPAAAWQGRDLAMSYVRDVPLSPKFRYEQEIGCTREWLPCPADGAWLKARIDAVGTAMPDWLDEEEGGPVLVVRDYKSAWTADADELRTLQRKIQAVLAWLHWGEDHEALRLEVVNFRLQRPCDTTVLPNTPEGQLVLERWRRDIASEIQLLEKAPRDASGRRVARPGAGCLGCPYLNLCPAALSYLTPLFGVTDREEVARSYASVSAILENLEQPARRLAREAPIPIPGGTVGWIEREERALVPDAFERLAEVWKRKAHPPDLETAQAQLPGLFRAAGLGVTHVEKLLTYLYQGNEEEREKRERLLHAMTKTKKTSRFGVHREVSDETAA